MNRKISPLFLVLFLCWTGLARAQTAIDPYTVTNATGSPCNGASVAGVFTCAVTGVTAGDTLIIVEADNSGTLTPVCTETAHSTALTAIKSTWQLSASAPAMWEGAWAINNASQTGYTISCNNGGASTQAQTIMVLEVHSSQGAMTIDETAPRVGTVSSDGGGPFVTMSTSIQVPLPSNGITVTDTTSSATATFVSTGSTAAKLYLNATTGFASGDFLSGSGLLPALSQKKNTSASTNWIGATHPNGSLAQPGELLVAIGGSVTTLTTLVSATGNKAFILPTGAKELTLPSFGMSTAVAGDVSQTGIGAQYVGGNFTASTSSANLSSLVAVKQATTPTIQPVRSNTTTPGEIIYATDTLASLVSNINLVFGSTSTFTSPLCAVVQMCVIADTPTTWPATSGTSVKVLDVSDAVQINNICTAAATPLACCTGTGTGTCTAYDEVYFQPIPTSCSGNIQACLTNIAATGGSFDDGSDYVTLFSGTNGCNVAGASSSTSGTGVTLTGPTHAGATAQSELIPASCDFFATRANPNPLLTGQATTGSGSGVATLAFLDFYPVQVAATAPAEVQTLSGSVPWIAGLAVLAGVNDPVGSCTANATVYLLNSSKHIMNGGASAVTGPGAQYGMAAIDSTNGFIVDSFTGSASGSTASLNLQAMIVDNAGKVCSGTNSATAAKSQEVVRVCTSANLVAPCTESGVSASYTRSVQIQDANGKIDDTF